MSAPARVYWHQDMTRYDFGPAHPMNPVRLDLTMRLADALDVLDHVDVIEPQAATAAELQLVHTAAFVAAVRACGTTGAPGDVAHGLGTPDVPRFDRMHEVSSLIVGATLTAVREVWAGEASHAFSPAGGLHHAMADHAAGFCVYNDVAVAITELLRLGAQRVAYVDVDVHHGDGVQEAFADDPRVLTVSVHEGPRTLYPGTGWADDVGAGAGAGTAVNVALPPGTADDQWLRAIHSVVPHLLDAFAPEILVTQHGCDSHVLDPLAHLAVTVDGQRKAAEALHGWAHEFAGGRWVASGGGGYAVVDVVPRTWTLLMAELAGAPIAPETPVPEAWRQHVAERLGRTAPLHMTDGAEPVTSDWSAGYDPSDPVDQAILATRRAVFPHHGLDPLRD